MLTEETRALTERFLDARSTADPAAIAPFLAEDVTWSTPPSLNIGLLTGRDIVADALSGKAAGKYMRVETIRRELVRLFVDEDTAVARTRMTAKTLEDVDYANEYVWIYTWRDHQLATLDEFTDTLHAARCGFVKL